MFPSVKIVGSYLSPYVRKVLAALYLKRIPYEIDPIIPFMGNDEFSQISPLRRIPVLIDDRVTLSDSSVICQYLEDRYPETSLYPVDIADRAHCRWLEEYADTRMGDIFIWKIFDQAMIHPYVWKKKDETIINRALKEEVPQILNFLESQLNEDEFIFKKLSLADLSIASFFRNLQFLKINTDPKQWPKTAGFVEGTLHLKCFEHLLPYEQKSLRTPIPHHREALRALGAPISEHTFDSSEPRPGHGRGP